MKTKLIISLTVLLSMAYINTFSQLYQQPSFMEYNYGDFNYVKGKESFSYSSWFLLNDMAKKYYKEKKYESTDMQIFYYKKGEIASSPKYRYISNYDEKGNRIKQTNYAKGELKSEIILTLNQSEKPLSYTEKKKGEIKAHEDFTYNAKGDAIAYAFYKGKDKKMKDKWNATYENDKIRNKVFYRKDEVQPSSEWSYEYYEDGTNKETKYFKKNKLKKVWSFECDELGKEVDLKDTVTLCQLTEYHNDGSYTEVYRSTSKKGKIAKTLKTFSADSVLISNFFYNHKNELRHGFERKLENEKVIYYAYYYNGKLRRQTYYSYDENGNMLKSEVKINKHIYQTVYTYSADNKVVTQVELKDGEPTHKREYEYNDEGNISKANVFKKDELKKTYVYSYTYYN